MSDSDRVWLAFDVSVFRCPPALRQAGTIRTHGSEVACLDERGLSRENVFAARFDEVLAKLAELPRTDVEPDGFFVRTGETGEECGRSWKMNGHLLELSDQLWRLDIRGECPQSALDEVLGSVGWPAVPVVFQLVRLGATVAEEDFRRWAALEHSAGE